MVSGEFEQNIDRNVELFTGGKSLVGPVNNFELTQDFRDVPTYYERYAAFFPFPPYTVQSSNFAASLESDELSKTLSLQLPDRIKNARIRSDTLLRRRLEARCATATLPSIVLFFGKQENPETEVCTLFCIPGILPQEALSAIQVRARQAIAKRN